MSLDNNDHKPVDIPAIKNYSNPGWIIKWIISEGQVY
jgi:hypothetical protein